MRKLCFTPALGLLLVSSACGTHKPGDTCTVNDPTVCDSSAAMLQCILGSYASIPCAGPNGCVAAGQSVSCDTSLATAGTPCPPAATGTVCQANPSATLSCINGVWQQQQACTSCAVQNGQAVCTGGTGGGAGGGTGGGGGGDPGCTPDTCLDGCCSNGQCIKAPLNGSNTFCGAAATYCVDCTATGKTCDRTTFSCAAPATGGGTGGSGGGTGGTGGTGGAGGSTVFPGAHSDYPTAMSYGGPVLSAPKFISITFSNDTSTFVQAADGFISAVGGSAYWQAIGAEYGVGAGTAASPIHLSEVAPTNIDDSGIQSWLTQKISSNAPGFGNPTSNTLYVIFYPATTHITLQGTASCSYFGGYHNSVRVGLRDVPYAVLPRCTEPNRTQIQTMTGSASHELIEAATDPYPNSNPAFGAVDLNHLAWEMYLLGEVSDLCAQEDSSFYTPSGFPYMVQRSWSNVAAAAGSDPCVPKSPGEIYYAAVPVLSDTVTFTFQGQSGQTKGVKIPLNTSKTIDVQLFSEAATAGWTVDAYDLSASTGGPQRLAFSWNKQSGNNGDVLKLTITAKSKDPQYGGELFVVIANKGTDYHAYYAFVGN